MPRNALTLCGGVCSLALSKIGPKALRIMGCSGTKDAELVNASLPRVADYLPPVVVAGKAPRCRKIGMLGAAKELATGNFLDLRMGRDDPEPDMKSIAQADYTNGSLTGALLATLVLPMWVEFTKDLVGPDNSYASSSAFGEMVGLSRMVEAAPYFGDLSSLCYMIAFMCFMLATIFSTFMLVMLDQCPDDDTTVFFLRELRWAKHMPYRCSWFAGPMCGTGVAIRIFLGTESVGFWVAAQVIIYGASVLVVLSWVLMIKALFTSRYDVTLFEDMELTAQQVEDDVAKYFAQEGEKALLDQCILSLSARSPGGVVLPMAPVTLARVKVAFLKALFKRLETVVSDVDIFRMATDSEVVGLADPRKILSSSSEATPVDRTLVARR